MGLSIFMNGEIRMPNKIKVWVEEDELYPDYTLVQEESRFSNEAIEVPVSLYDRYNVARSCYLAYRAEIKKLLEA